MRVSFIVLALAGLWASIASADALGMPPTDCPAGTVGQVSHSRPYCAPARCSGSASCGAGACEPMAQCIGSAPCGGNAHIVPDGGTQTCFIEISFGPCAADGSCTSGACQMIDACSAPPPSGGGCAVGMRPATVGAWMIVVAVAITLARRASKKR